MPKIKSKPQPSSAPACFLTKYEVNMRIDMLLKERELLRVLRSDTTEVEDELVHLAQLYLRRT